MPTSAATRAKMRAHLEPAARALMKVWYLKTMAGRLEERTPKDLPQYRWHGKAHRVLLIGNGPTHGWGVLTHGYSLTGQLGAELHAVSRKPVNVDYVGDVMMNVLTAKDWIQDLDLTVYDTIIMLMGWNDAARMTPKAVWEENIAALFNDIRNRKRVDAGFVAVGIESMSPATGYAGLVGRLGDKHAAKLNDVLQKQMSHAREVFLPLGERAVQYRDGAGSPEVYQFWAEQIARAAAPLLPEHAPEQALERDTQVFRWAGAARALGRDGLGVSTVFAELEDKARRTFGTKLAQVTVLDGERQWFPNHLGPAPASAPRHLTYCHVAAQQEGGLLIVPNSNKDERFKNNPYLAQSSMPFYAGKALYDREGNVIGSFCVLDVVPRPKWLANSSKRKLERFAEQAQAELWRIEDEVRAEVAKLSSWNPNVIDFAI